MEKGLISIIIPTHKGRDLTGVLNAIYSSTYKNFEVIIVDEGKKRSEQRNIGIDRAKGDYLLFLDSDMQIATDLLQDCLRKMIYSNGIYLQEKIMTPGLFARIRDWERQFYTGTAIDCVRFVQRNICPRFNETMNGPEDSDFERQIAQPKTVSDAYYYHYEDVNMIQWFKKKAYYSGSMDKFIAKYPNDKILDWKWRCFWVFMENGKWKKFLSNPIMAIAIMVTILVRGIIFLWRKHLL
ncbi:MAG: glycosyltransferase family 2 protein [Candidatus Omnitrophota bacterium]